MNFGLFLFFIVTCFRATKIIREKIGLFASIVFVLGLLSFTANSNNNGDQIDKNTNQIRKWRFSPHDKITPMTSNFLNVTLDETIATKIDLAIGFGLSKETNKPVPTEAFSSVQGLVGGHKWKPTLISISPTTTEKHFKYIVNGILEWKLLGATIYSQPKTFIGFIDTK